MAKRTDYQIAIDDCLTKNLNQYDPVNDYMTACAAALYREFRADDRMFFYVKGSAALSRYLRLGGVPGDALNAVCARSDWDTQLVINPRLSRAAWFTAFRDALTIIRRSLDTFEEGLLAVFTRMYLSQRGVDGRLLQGKSADPAIRKAQNALAQAVREEIAAQFGKWFLETSGNEGFIAEGSRHWDLPWPTIGKVAVKDILELDIQAYSRSTLTFALIHPGQALDNLNSIMTGEELGRLKHTTQAVAEDAWTKMSGAAAAYDRLWIALISKTPAVTDFLRGAIPGALVDATSIESLIDTFPAEIITGTIGRLPTEHKDRLGALWTAVEEADEDSTLEETEFCAALAISLKANQDVAGQLAKWCQGTFVGDEHMLTALAALYYPEVVARLDGGQKKRLAKAEEEVETWIDRYREEPDPEDVAEAEKRETESLAPFTLVSVEKGGRKTGSILENMTIRDFYLFRLMIRCQLSNKDQQNRLIPDAPLDTDFDSFKQQFKFRAELLDISVPRDDSLETAEQWAHVRTHIKPDGQGVPLPDGSYFLDEYILMFREVLDRKSSSVHKLTKRLRRACLIAQVYAGELGGLLTKRCTELALKYPPFEEITKATLPAGPANLVVFMRMCEQLVESYDLFYNERLRQDSALMMMSFRKEIAAFLRAKLTEDTFLDLMRVYARLGRLIYNQNFTLGQVRAKQIPDEKMIQVATAVMGEIRTAFKDRPGMVRCGVVEDFAIMAEPELPASLKQDLSLNVVTILVYAKPAAGDAMKKVLDVLTQKISTLGKGFGAVLDRDTSTLYGRYSQKSIEPVEEDSIRFSRRAVFLKIKFVFDDNPANWVLPAHQYDLRTIVKQYRQSLPAYTEYHVLTMKKHILQQMETTLTTY